MDFKNEYPDFQAIEHHIRRARIERSVAVAQALAGLVTRIGRGLKKIFTADQFASTADRRAIESDAFLKRWVPKA